MRMSSRRAFGQENRVSCDAGPGRRRTRPRSFAPNGGLSLLSRQRRLAPVSEPPRLVPRSWAGVGKGRCQAAKWGGTTGQTPLVPNKGQRSFHWPTSYRASVVQPAVRAHRQPGCCARRNRSMPAPQQCIRPVTALFITSTFRFAKKASVLHAVAGSKRGGQALGIAQIAPAPQPRPRRIHLLEGARNVRSHCPHRYRLRPPAR